MDERPRSKFRLMLPLALLLAALVMVAAACGGDDDSGGEAAGGETLAQVQERGVLNCGVNGTVPGFSFPNPDGVLEGFDVDYCKAVAAAVLGDANAVEYTELTAEQRFTSLQAGEIDVLIRNTTRTSSRDGNEGTTFLTTTFYDGQGMMVPADSPYETLEDMEGTAICVLSGTTTELNLEAQFSARGISYEPLSFEDNPTLQEAFQQGRCDGWTSDKSQLGGIRSNFPAEAGGPEALRVLEVTMSKEPLGPVVRDGDSQWAQIIDWIAIATIQAEEFGINSGNLAEALGSDNPEIQRFLGQPGEDGNVFDPGLGLPTDFAVKIIEQVGNYAEIYDRHVTPIGVPRAVVNLNWLDGGLLYAPPYR